MKGHQHYRTALDIIDRRPVGWELGAITQLLASLLIVVATDELNDEFPVNHNEWKAAINGDPPLGA